MLKLKLGSYFATELAYLANQPIIWLIKEGPTADYVIGQIIPKCEPSFSSTHFFGPIVKHYKKGPKIVNIKYLSYMYINLMKLIDEYAIHPIIYKMYKKYCVADLCRFSTAYWKPMQLKPELLWGRPWRLSPQPCLAGWRMATWVSLRSLSYYIVVYKY